MGGHGLNLHAGMAAWLGWGDMVPYISTCASCSCASLIIFTELLLGSERCRPFTVLTTLTTDHLQVIKSLKYDQHKHIYFYTYVHPLTHTDTLIIQMDDKHGHLSHQNLLL
ncbi:hypothetical protein ILYODFUR_023454 [Ilyodon furcidens]|uniref:Uncharacterized protein n=1 Tax=Ilyodon furcidens TaxID=33524 RepID=A0ABV0TX26_9TELE